MNWQKRWVTTSLCDYNYKCAGRQTTIGQYLTALSGNPYQRSLHILARVMLQNEVSAQVQINSLTCQLLTFHETGKMRDILPNGMIRQVGTLFGTSSNFSPAGSGRGDILHTIIELTFRDYFLMPR
jgi:hypothetical protein